MGTPPHVNKITDSVYEPCAKHSPTSMLLARRKGYSVSLKGDLMTATDRFVVIKNVGMKMYTTRLCFSVSTRLPHYSLIFDSEFIGILLALQKASANILKVNTLADTPFVLASLGNGGTGRDYAQHLYDLISSHIQKFQLSRVPGHVGIRQNECLSAVNSWHMVTATSHSLCLNWGSRFKFLIFFHSVETLGVSITAPSAVPYISLY